MKKGILALLAAAVLSMGAVQAAESAGPVSTWMNNVTGKVSAKEQSAAAKAQAKKKAAAKKQAEAKAKQAQREKAAAAKKAAAQKKQAERKQKVETKKKQWKELFSVD